jgi:Tol biopolymer transport system component
MIDCRKCILLTSIFLMIDCICFGQSNNPARNETIAYEYRPDDRAPYPGVDVYSIRADGTNEKALTQDAHSHSPSWSPDGRRILFIHDSTLQTVPFSARHGANSSGHPVELYVMDRDGGNSHLLRRLEPVIVRAAWSPDAGMLVVNLVGGLYLLPLDGQGEPKMLYPGVYYDPVLSPDGRRIAFSAHVLDPRLLGDDGKPLWEATPMHWAIHSANVDGSMESQLTDPILMAREPAWAPDGQQIAFSGSMGGLTGAGKEQIFLMSQDGSGVRQLTNDPDWTSCRSPSWSPDGHRIVFTCFAASPRCSGSVGGGSRLALSQCVRRIFVISVQNPPHKLSPIIDRDGYNPTFAPVN